MSTVLVAGAAGLLGSAVARRLAGEGEQVLAADFLGASGGRRALREARAAALGTLENVTLARTDLSSMMRTGPLLRRHRPAAVVNAALYDPDGPGLAPLIELSRTTGVGFFLHLSDAALYPDPPEPGARAREVEARDAGGDPYLTQRLREEALLEESGLPYAILRVFSVLEPELPEGRPSVQEMEALLKGGPASPFDDEPRDLLHVDDAARGVHAALLRKPAGEIVNLGSGVAVRPSEAVRALTARTGSAFSFRVSGPPPARRPRAADTAKASSLLAFTPEWNIAALVARNAIDRRPGRADKPAPVSRRELFDWFRKPLG